MQILYLTMYLIFILFFFVLAGNALDKDGICPIFQKGEQNIVFNNKNKVYTSPIRERTLFHSCLNCESALSVQINMELRASYIYQTMAWHFDRDDVALDGMHKFFEKSSVEEREHASKLIRYLNERGGNYMPEDIKKPDKYTWDTPLMAMQTALDLETYVYTGIRKLHDVAAISEDFHLMDFLESYFFTEQVSAINKLSRYVTKLKRMGCGIGETMFDKELIEEMEHSSTPK